MPKSEQPRYLAFVGATVSIAFIVGPGMGSGLGEFGLRVPFFVSGALGGCGLVFAYFKLRETHPDILRARAKKTDAENDTGVALTGDSENAAAEASTSAHSLSASSSSLALVSLFFLVSCSFLLVSLVKRLD